MINNIGETAGLIYRALESGGKLTIAKIKKEVEADSFIFYAAIGWLAREGKIEISKSGRSIVLSLK
jgi:hypothetical protein